MIGYVMVGTNNLDKAIIFYDEVLKIINLTRKDTDDVCAGYTQNNGDGSIEFYVTKPANKKTATFGNGTQVSFLVSSREIVDKFHEIALKAGGTSEGSGGERPEGSGVYYSYIRDLDGNKICAFTNNK
ncbi:VOC family protein [Candidatus Pelagibacter sp.]|jgi:catechol 2,3-dioxygenase-like lactoylglutathione lyase family enzyme|nr:VOC family protein [Candidatus Pelagibacter sp.]|tara:strand:- start:356 stop:739 length:384 start_codon:yes stop_codon:yes gene_type:complete